MDGVCFFSLNDMFYYGGVKHVKSTRKCFGAKSSYQHSFCHFVATCRSKHRDVFPVFPANRKQQNGVKCSILNRTWLTHTRVELDMWAI